MTSCEKVSGATGGFFKVTCKQTDTVGIVSSLQAFQDDYDSEDGEHSHVDLKHPLNGLLQEWLRLRLSCI